MSDTPIIIKDPTLVIQSIDAAGADVGSPVDVSCDIASVELSPDVPVTSVVTFCGTFQIPGDLEVGCDVEYTVNSDTFTRWSPLVGDSAKVRIKDRTTDTTYREFVTQIPMNPGLYGPTTPGESRTFTAPLPVLSEVTLVTPS